MHTIAIKMDKDSKIGRKRAHSKEKKGGASVGAGHGGRGPSSMKQVSEIRPPDILRFSSGEINKRSQKGLRRNSSRQKGFIQRFGFHQSCVWRSAGTASPPGRPLQAVQNRHWLR
eukprot:TRINITY_DN42200_c0_g1_i1.p1 TRINITY_DN42200_c0_g1~~TRINITY_DN42200_c0_g1_i1.p1  ORF type:complete len:126 (+),score=0.22 TRINITY_DN42200_c0_g1_i1:34-378(+)